MSKQVKVSVVIPVHNVEDFIRQTLDSLLSQEGLGEDGMEIICVDDCSTDGTGPILLEYAQRYQDKVRVLTNVKNVFAGASRNRGLLAAKGEYVHFLDSDDYVLPGAYQKLIEYCDKHELDWVKTSCKALDETSQEEVEVTRYKLGYLAEERFDTLMSFYETPDDFLYRMSVVPWNALYRRQFLLDNQIRFNSLLCCNDRSFFVESCVKGGRMMAAKIDFVMHRTNVSNSLVARRANHFNCQFQNYEIAKKICSENNLSEELRFLVLENEMMDVFRWYRRFLASGAKMGPLVDEFYRWITDEEIEYYKEKNKTNNVRWLKHGKLVGI